MAQLKLKGFSFQALFTSAGLADLDRAFLDHLQSHDPAAAESLICYRNNPEAIAPAQLSELLIRCAGILEAFIAELFGIENAVARLQAATQTDDPIFAFKKHYVLREARRHLKKELNVEFEVLDQWLSQQVEEEGDRELAVAQFGQRLLEDAQANKAQIEQLIHWCTLAIRTDAGQVAVAGWVSFHFPKKLDYSNLVDVAAVPEDSLGRLQSSPTDFRQRDGFALTDPRMSAREALDEMHYCVYCHDKSGDFCSKGFPVKKTQPELGLKVSPTNEILTGCPLEEKISEMQWLKKKGYGVAALAMVMVDNPMCPATGHRICNDCMKACIYQKQEPVNIPQAETRVLFDVLQLPWGVELYDLLTRWNPLRPTQYIAKPYNGLKVLVMGMGPAGFTLAQHLLQEGFAVVGVDGLKLEPLDRQIFEQPIHDYNTLVESLDSRVMAGFGGVAEYGITVRWDKNFLKLIYISLMRRPYFQTFGSVRFGGTVTVDDVWDLGFDHLALAVGAGLPRELRIPNSLAPGMRQANDFLMALQLTGAAKRSSFANLQVRLPAVVIGGGLTGVDTATEVQAYYITQVEKTLWRYETLVAVQGQEQVRAAFDPHSLNVLDEFLSHGIIVRQERAEADRQSRLPDFIGLIRGWGGVTIAYRRTMQESPAYQRNHEELTKALEEGIYYAEGLEPSAVILDEFGYVAGLKCRSRVMDEVGNWMSSDEEQQLPARALFVATGAQPNVAYEYEHAGTFKRDGKSYSRHQLVDDVLKKVEENTHVKMDEFGVFTSYERDHHRVSFLGDTHAVFHGSVVKAMASAKRSYPKIAASLSAQMTAGDETEYQKFHKDMEYQFRSKIIEIKRHNDKLVELIVRSPMSAQNFQPGQFYRIQNYEVLAKKVHHTRLQTEALAVLGVRRTGQPDQLSFMVYEGGSSARLVATFKVGSLLSVMGPTGVKSSLSSKGGGPVMIIGGVTAIAYALSVAPAIREKGHRVLFVGVFEDEKLIYCRDAIERSCDSVLWTNGDFMGALVECQDFPVSEIDRVIVVGASQLVRQIRDSKALKALIAPQAEFLASVYGPMQCMLKGVCAQCLQWQIDPATGQRKKAVYACSWQHQPMEKIDIANIDERLGQNRSQEILSNLWLDYLLNEHNIEHI
jgi:NADPH-dependent glutamate synthase beta subunit-like oxidoreductase/NAD(P)H-flavin reductase